MSRDDLPGRPASDVFVARQPIFNVEGGVFAYELLFRSGPENYCPASDSDAMSSQVISDGVSLWGLDALTGRRKAFINFSRRSLVEDLALLLPHQQVVIEVLESVEPDDEVVEAVKRAKDAGYAVALDDFTSMERYAPLLDLVDYVKVDFLLTADEDERARLARHLSSRGITMLAEKVETQNDVAMATRCGYTLFQGYFFARPVVIPARDVPAFRLNYLRLLARINEPDVSLETLEAIIKQEVSMSFRLLRYINSAAVGLQVRADSVRSAIVLLGTLGVRKLASVWAVAGLGRDRPAELVVTATTRARFCENIAGAAGLAHEESRAFLVGMFSLIDAIMGRPLDEVVEALGLGPSETGALLHREGILGQVLDCAVTYERGDWTACLALASRIGVGERALAESYLRAADWARDVFGA